MTETSPVITVNTFDAGHHRFGTVGRVIDDIEVKIAPEPGYPDGEGEICTRGPLLMMGYYKNPEATAETIDTEGWLHTGDIGKFDKDGFLYITDRKKEIFKTSGGKYISPQALENKMKESVYIEQLAVVGAGQKFPSALIVPTFPALEEWAKARGLKWQDRSELVQLPDVIKLFDQEVDQANTYFAQFEKVKKFVLMPEEWTIDGEELTPTLKLKRRIINAKYANQIAGMYEE